MNVYIVDIEAVDTRYTKQWKEHLPEQLQRALVQDVAVLGEVKVISGGEVPQATTPGAFLNFGGTNVYKSNQLQQIATLFCEGKIHDGDYFLYTDAWNPTVIQLRYMARLLNVDITIGGMWHAGSYDPQDFLGRLIGDEPWVRNAEQSMFDCYDHNFFATQFHVDLFRKSMPLNNVSEYLGHVDLYDYSKFNIVGWPMEYLRNSLEQYKGMEKRDLIVFPHRIAPEKQVDIFRDLADSMPEYEWVVCQDQTLSKNEYHNLLGEAKLMFSANLQETLGISWYEGVLVDVIPMVPDRLSYSEMAIQSAFCYPSEMTESWDKYLEHKDSIMQRIRNYMGNYVLYLPQINKQVKKLEEQFFSGQALYDTIKQTIT